MKGGEASSSLKKGGKEGTSFFSNQAVREKLIPLCMGGGKRKILERKGGVGFGVYNYEKNGEAS